MLDPGQKKKGGYKRGASKASGKAGYIRGRGLELKQIRREGIDKSRPKLPWRPAPSGKAKPRPMPTLPPSKGKFKPRPMPINKSGIEYWKK